MLFINDIQYLSSFPRILRLRCKEMLLDMVGFCYQHKTKRIQCRFLSYRTKKLSLASKSQTEKRMIRVATEIPEKCFPGSQLENVVFEIVKSDGVIDGTVNDNEKGDMSHALVLKSDLTDIDDSVKCSFRHGCCPVCAIPLPQIEGSFSFLAAHSRYRKLIVTITVLVEKAPEIVYDSSQPQCTDEDNLSLRSHPIWKLQKFSMTIDQ
ncbi:structural maintenance of chromosomes flexible hinge domain-containing protein GMI1-like isoform X3 [Daucus carota subsp. sativus]|uniref:structural maintenance of chromosomes flexible hinge domain-containing protein GMI1-like isoform X3 n=2 Tax=Daucus carota subsp. sativus TaxID=79200 RepID=UPI003083A936